MVMSVKVRKLAETDCSRGVVQSVYTFQAMLRDDVRHESFY